MNDTKWLRTDLNVVNLTGLDSGIDTYSISLSAHNALGSSPNMTLNLKTIGRGEQTVMDWSHYSSHACTHCSHTAPAGSPLHLTIVSLGPTSISLRWSELECAQRGGTITGYMLEYKESIRNEWMSLIVPKERAEVGNLTESTTYLFRIAAMNVNGMGPFSDIETGTSTGTYYSSYITVLQVKTLQYFFYISKAINSTYICYSSSCVDWEPFGSGAVLFSMCNSLLIQVCRLM